jgi:HSP20 family protein
MLPERICRRFLSFPGLRACYHRCPKALASARFLQYDLAVIAGSSVSRMVTGSGGAIVHDYERRCYMLPSLWRPFSSDILEPFDVTDWSWPDDAFAEMDRLGAEMDRMFQRFSFGDRARLPFGDRALLPAITYPALDMWQDNACLYVEAELPGMEIGDLDISVTGGDQLTIRGERKPPSVEKGNWHRQERGYGRFSRVRSRPMRWRHSSRTVFLPSSCPRAKLPSRVVWPSRLNRRRRFVLHSNTERGG